MIFSEIDNTLYCTFSEQLDGSFCPVFEQELAHHIAEFKTTHKDARLVFDLDKVVFISSTFLRICLIHFKTCEQDCFTIANVPEEIYKVFYVSGFTEIMNVIPKNPPIQPPEQCPPEQCEKN